MIERRVGGAIGADKGQEHQRILQPLGFVDGHYLHQFAFRLQPQHLLGRLAIGVGDGFGEPAQQGIFAIKLHAGLLQQFTQVQHIGEAPLAIGSTQQTRRQLPPLQQLMEHGQHPLTQPETLVVAKLLNRRLPGQFVTGQLLQLTRIEIKQGTGQRGPQLALIRRLLASLQQQQEIRRLLLGKDAIPVGEIDRGNAQPRQGLLDQPPLGTGAHQYRHIAGLERLLTYLGLPTLGQAQ